jgi:Ser/Thr protein kinase RdoA (MazF antagonist)
MSLSVKRQSLINKTIVDRKDVFYWQTDRDIEPKEAGSIWADRHSYFTDKEIIEKVNRELADDKLASITKLDPSAQTNLGNVNSVRTGVLVSGKQVIIRCHPKGINNGYFHVEALAAQRAKEAGLPSFSTLAIHDYQGGDDFAFQVIDKLPGKAVQKQLELDPSKETKLVHEIGVSMARLHKIGVEGFGPFDNELAKLGELKGLHSTFAEFTRAGLQFNLDVLVSEGLLSQRQVAPITDLFSDKNPLLAIKKGCLVHNDFADWNLLTNGENITGIIDWDECIVGDPVADIACWSTFFDPSRLDAFLVGYWSVSEKPADFEAKFELLRLRYTLSKMTLRLRKFSWNPSEDVRKKIEYGKIHLALSLKNNNIVSK